MKANELRIGNYIYNDTKKVTKIDGFMNSSIYENVEDERVRFILSNITYCNPIPLTEEWLLKFGFIKDLSVDEIKYFISIPNLKCEIHAVLFRGVYVIEIHNHLMPIIPELDFVHQLQNLYFALTNEELTQKD